MFFPTFQRFGWSAALRVTTLVLLGLAIAASLQAQNPTAAVRGRVVNAVGGEPLGLVQVVLLDTPWRTVTDDAGEFQLTAVPAGHYVFEVTAVGFHPVRQEFAVDSGETRAFDVALTSTRITLTDSATVTAGAFAAPEPGAGAFTLEGHEIANLASVLADDPLRAVQSLPGVTSNNDFSSEFSVRGAPFRRVGVYLDGVPLHSPFHTTDGSPENGSLSILSGDLTSDMTLYQGAWPVRYSDRTAGMLAVDTRPGTREGVREQVSASASNVSVLAEGPLDGKRGSWIVSGRRSYLQYILNRVDFGDQPPFVFGFADLQGRLDYDLNSRQSLSLTILDGLSSVDRSRYRDELSPATVMTSDFHSDVFNLGWRYMNPRVLMTSHLAWSKESGRVGNRDEVRLFDIDHREVTLQTDATILWSPHHTLEFGGQAQRIVEAGAATQLLYAPDLTTTVDQYHGATWQGGAFVQETLTRGPIRLGGGLRVDRQSASAASVTTPYVTLSFQSARGTHVQFDVGRYGQFADLSQSFSRFTDDRLAPERSTHFDALVEQQINSRTRVRVELYDREDHDLLARPALDPRLSFDGVVVDADPFARWRSALHGHARGVDVTVQKRSANGFTGWISYAYASSEVEDDTLGLQYPSDYDQHHTMNAFVSRRLRPTVNVSGRVTLGSGMPIPGFYRLAQGQYELDTARNQLRAPIYQRTDLRINKEYIRRRYNLTLFAEVVNVTNRTNRDFDTPGPYDASTTRAAPNFYTMFPILPSLGLVIAFGHGGLHQPG
jgi:hypothetical protein